MGCFLESSRLHVRLPFKSNKRVDIDILNAAKNAVKVGQTAANAVAVPGLPVVLDVLTVILEKTENAQSNKEGLEALCTEVQKISEGIEAILKNVEPRLESDFSGGSVRTALQNTVNTEYGDLPKRISSFESKLRNVAKEADVLIGRSWWRRWLSSSQDATTLTDLKDRIARAYQSFQFDGAIEMEVLLNQIVDNAIDSQRMLQKVDSDEVLKKLSCDIEPDFRSASNNAKSLFLDGTRTGVFEELDQWMDASSLPLHGQRIYMVEGGAGMGKSTIASEFCRRLEARGLLGASFFFVRGIPKRDCTAAFVPNVVGQLARSHPELLPLVLAAADKHFRRGGQAQQVGFAVKDLLDPLCNFVSQAPLYIVIDALDECSEDESPDIVATWFRLLLSFVTESISFRLLVTTRPISSLSPSLRATVESVSDRIRTISLYDPLATQAVDEDIASLIRSLLDSNPASASWLARNPSVVDALTKRAKGLFVYARTATVFLMADNYNFDARLQLLLPEPSDSIRSAGPIRLNDLDSLYRTLLTTAFPADEPFPTKDQVRRVLAGLLVMSDTFYRRPFVFDNLLLGGTAPAARSAPILERLRPVLTVEDEEGPVDIRVFTIMHDTFREFLTSDKSRAGDFFMSAADAHTVVAIGCMELLCAAVEPKGDGWAMDGWEQDRLLVIGYARVEWQDHLSHSREGRVDSRVRDALAETVDSSLGTESQQSTFINKWQERMYVS